jgi:hypothetical protein
MVPEGYEGETAAECVPTNRDRLLLRQSSPFRASEFNVVHENPRMPVKLLRETARRPYLRVATAGTLRDRRACCFEVEMLTKCSLNRGGVSLLIPRHIYESLGDCASVVRFDGG